MTVDWAAHALNREQFRSILAGGAAPSAPEMVNQLRQEAGERRRLLHAVLPHVQASTVPQVKGWLKDFDALEDATNGWKLPLLDVVDNQRDLIDRALDHGVGTPQPLVDELLASLD